MVFYDVITPLGHDRCETEHEVSERIASFMRVEGASLDEVTVVRVPETGDRSVVGEPLAPGYFWTPAQE